MGRRGKLEIMKNSKLIPLLLIVLTGCQFSQPTDWKEIELNCKTEKGGEGTFLINKNPPSVKETKTGLSYKVLVFSPSKLVFKSESSTEVFPHLYRSEFTYTIDRTDLKYQVNLKNFSTDDKYPKTGKDGDNIPGKCSVVPQKSVAF